MHANLGSDRGAIGNAPGALNHQPVVAVSIVAVEQIVLPVQIGDEQIEETIVVIVSPGAPISNGAVIDEASRRDFREGAIPVVMVKKIVLARAARRAVGDEKIEEPIIVVICPGRAPGISNVGDEGARGDFREGAVPVDVVEKVLLVGIGDEKIEEPVIVIIVPGGPQRAASVRHDAAGGDFRESPVPVVVIEKIVLVIVRDEQKVAKGAKNGTLLSSSRPLRSFVRFLAFAISR